MVETFRCPVHGIPDCSPLLNGCSIPNKVANHVVALENEILRLRRVCDDWGNNYMSWVTGAARVWDEGFEEGFVWQQHTNGIPHDPPINPYEKYEKPVAVKGICKNSDGRWIYWDCELGKEIEPPDEVNRMFLEKLNEKAKQVDEIDYDEILALPLSEDSQYDSGAETIGGYLHKLLHTVWNQGEGFSGKRPFGNSGWEFSLLEPLIDAGHIKGTFYTEEYEGETVTFLEDIPAEEEKKGYKIIFGAIDHIFKTYSKE